jgi:uncharacterized membrane protein
MESRAKFLGHALHQQLIPFPLGLLGMAVVFDLLAALFDRDGLARAADYMIIAGIITGLIAAVFGAIDWAAIPDGTRAKRVGTLHGAGNVVVIALFTLAYILRRNDPANPDTLVLLIEIVAAGLALGTGWLGGELVDRLAVGIDRGAHLNAPNSRSGRPAHEGQGQ